jgi:hypothetical protein
VFSIIVVPTGLPLPCIVVADRIGQHGPRWPVGWQHSTSRECNGVGSQKVNLALCRLVT